LDSDGAAYCPSDSILLFRLYGPDRMLFDKTWSLGDVEKVK